jgi:predicted outer membrane repeat protein
MSAHPRHRLRIAALATAALASTPALALDGVVGPGNCNESGLAAVVAQVDGAGGGTITFDCGTATIPLTAALQIANMVTIDGGGTITLDGGGASAFVQVYSSAQVTLAGLTLQHGVFDGVHALENFGTLRLDRVRMRDNIDDGPPVANYGLLQVQRSSFSGNAATSSSADGGAIANIGGELQVETSTFNANTAGRNGGAIYSDSLLTIRNATFTGNQAFGGGAVFQASGLGSIEYATIVANGATFGAGLYNEGGSGGTLTIGRSIVSANADGNCDGVLASSGYNLSNDTGCGGAFTGPGDLIGQSLPMGSLADNGGPTLTMLPLAGNPAIDHVPDAQCLLTVDQRGASRPAGPGCDSGAVEAGAALDVIFIDGFDGFAAPER